MTAPLDALIVVSDLHCGSPYGLAPPSFRTDDGNDLGHGSNAHQAWLWHWWRTLIAEAAERLRGATIGVIVNGDATEGNHHRSTEMTTPREHEHCKMAYACLLPLAKHAPRRYVIDGTECHTKGLEHDLARMLHAEGGKAHGKLLLEVHGCLLDITHHIGVTSRAYLEASGMGINMGNARLNYARVGQRVPSVYLRGHRHAGGIYSDGYGIMAVSGGWQYLTRHGRKVVPDSICTPTVIVLDWRGRKYGGLPHAEALQATPPEQRIVAA